MNQRKRQERRYREQLAELNAWLEEIERRSVKGEELNWFQKLKIAWAVNSKVKEVNRMKAGWKTTEFWVTVFTALSGLLGQYGGFIPEPWGIVATSVIGAGYTISRGLAKHGQTNGETPKPS